MDSTTLTAERIFDWSARFGLLSALLVWGLLASGVGGHLVIALMAASFVASYLYVWYQLRLKATGRAHQNDGLGLVLSCLLPLGAMGAIPLMMLTFFPVAFRG